MNIAELPNELQSIIGSERVDFVTFAKRKNARPISYAVFGLALPWLIITTFGVYVFFKPLFIGEDIHMETDGVVTTANLDNLEPIIVPGSILLVFFAIGILLFIWGLRYLLKKGGYYVGTETRIINYIDGEVMYLGWNEFTGNMELDLQKKTIVLEMHRGETRREKDGSEIFVHDTLDLIGVEDASEVDEKCRKRINESQSTSA